MNKEVFEIARYLAESQREEGLEDSEKKRVIQNSYGTEFYSLLCALIYKDTKNKLWLKRAIDSLNSSVKIIKSRRNVKGIFRWDFKKYALIKTYSLLKNELTAELKKDLEWIIKDNRNVYSFETNRLALSAVNLALRYKEFNDETDIKKAKKLISVVLKRQTDEGFFSDTTSSYSSQYHSFVLALLYEYFLLTKDDNIEHFFMKGVDCAVSLMGKNGSFDFGRGKKQIFGYASIVFALYGAAKIMNDSYYAQIAHKIESNVLKEMTFNKYSIVLDDEKLEPYNHLSDYLPFFACYLLSSERETLKLKATKKVILNLTQKFPKREYILLNYLIYHLSKYCYYLKNYLFSPYELWLTFKYYKNPD